MKINNILKNGIFFLFGILIANLTLHIRFNNDLLREELLLLMEQNNNGYFLTIAYLPVLPIFVLIIMILYNLRVDKRIERSKE